MTRAAGKALPGSIDKYPVEIKPVPGGFKSGPTLSTVTTQNGVSTSKSTRAKNAQGTATRSGNSPNVVVPVDTTQRFDRPIPIGVSSFNAQTLDTGGVGVLCASGTLGCRAKDSSGKLYAISNSHVWGALGAGTVGELIVQPSQGDNNCLTQTDINTIGTLADFTSYINDVAGGPFFRSNTLPLNFIDAALMEVSDAADPTGALVPAVGFATPSDGYGAPSSNILRANRIGLQVQKHGRTTGYTRGYTSAVNIMATIGGAVPNEDADYYRLDEFLGLPPFASLGAPGDSGSLIVTMDGRRPVALLFAGGSAGALQKTVTLGNLIGPVLDRFNVRVDDGTTAAVHTGGVSTTGISARGGLALGNLSEKDLADFQVVDAAGIITNELLPAELRGRVRPNQRPLIPSINGSGP
jgi:hypothetical protein